MIINIQYAGGDERQWQQIYLTTNLNPEWQQVQIGKMTKAGITDKFQSRNSWAFLFRVGSWFAPSAEVWKVTGTRAAWDCQNSKFRVLSKFKTLANRSGAGTRLVLEAQKAQAVFRIMILQKIRDCFFFFKPGWTFYWQGSGCPRGSPGSPWFHLDFTRSDNTRPKKVSTWFTSPLLANKK